MTAMTNPEASGPLMRGAIGCPSPDELAQQDICSALLSTRGLDARHIEVEMTASGVLLRGYVADADARAQALRIARRLAAPRPVREELQLRSGRSAGAPGTRSPKSAPGFDPT